MLPPMLCKAQDSESSFRQDALAKGDENGRCDEDCKPQDKRGQEAGKSDSLEKLLENLEDRYVGQIDTEREVTQADEGSALSRGWRTWRRDRRPDVRTRRDERGLMRALLRGASPS